MGILDQIVGNAGNTGQPRRGLLGAVGGAQGLLQNPATMDLGLALLANSGYQSRRRGFGEILGTSMLQSRQMAAEAAQQKLREQYMQAQIQAMQQKPEAAARSPFAAIDPSKYSPESIVEFQKSGNYGSLVPTSAPSGGSDPREIAIARALNDPTTPEPVKNDLRKLMDRMYREPAPPREPEPRIVNVPGRGLIAIPPGGGDPQFLPGTAPPPATVPVPMPSATERTAANYSERMIAAEGRIGEFVPSIIDYSAGMNMLAGGSLRGALANRAMTPAGRQYFQAASDWVRAKLRKESGAVIGEDEMAAEIKTYFPLPGDDAVTVENKKISRQQAMAGMQGEAGRATQPPPPGRGAPENAPAPGGPQLAEGTVISNAQGKELVLRNGQWVPR